MIAPIGHAPTANDIGPGEGFAFPMGARRVVAARRMVVAGDGALPATVREDVLLLVTELVNNAVRDGGVGAERSLRVELRLWPRQVRVEVVDPGTGVASTWSQDRSKSGLFLVGQIADRWGVKRAGSGTCVWFEIEFEG